MEKEIEREEGDQRREDSETQVPKPTEQDHRPRQRGHADEERDEDEGAQSDLCAGAQMWGLLLIYRGPGPSGTLRASTEPPPLCASPREERLRPSRIGHSPLPNSDP